ncbi:hypothetical protein IJJ49_02390 [Candidatus Saccharibacteria bacterium]|nr:hypothetical protein [Candidatus Saccharibacteria bacterium]
MKRLVLIDGKSVFYRGYYAMPALGLPDGTPTGGIYGFAAIAMEIVKELDPTKVVVAWDSKTSVTRRRAIYKDYKAGRVKPGDDFYAQIPLLEELIKDLGWNFIEVENYEADDIIGTLSKQADKSLDEKGNCEYETYIISSDLDMLQIVDENTHMWRILKGFTNIEQIDIAEIETKYNIKKSQFLDLKALKGDSSDNIPGVPGIGEKTAAKLLGDFGSLENIYKNLDKISGSTRTKLESGRDLAFMSKDLAKIMFDAPVALAKIPDFSFNPERIVKGLKKLQFNSLIKKIDNIETEENNINNVENKNIQIPKDIVIDYNIKTLMHDNQKIAEEILSGKKPFWDLSQAAFLLNPLARETPMLVDVNELYKIQLSEFEKNPKLYNIYKNFDLPLIPILYKMEKKGALIDRVYFEKLKEEYSAEVQKIEQEVYNFAGCEFNLNSPVQLAEILFNTLALPTKGI